MYASTIDKDIVSFSSKTEATGTLQQNQSFAEYYNGDSFVMKQVEHRQRVEIAIEENIVESESDHRKSTPKEEEK